MDKLSIKVPASVYICKKPTNALRLALCITYTLLESKNPGADRCGLTYLIICLYCH